MKQRTIFFISDGTGVTAESLRHLLTHFVNVNFRQIRFPFTDSYSKIETALEKIAAAGQEDGQRAIVVMTLVNPQWREKLRESGALCLDLFGAFIDPLTKELQEQPSRTLGLSHAAQGANYFERIEAINYALSHDDGMTESGLEQASVILIGVSRCGKTPTSLYLAMQFSIKAANYPLIPEDLERKALPAILNNYRNKLFGLTIKANRLHSVREQRRPASFYSSLENCRNEINLAEALMLQEKITCLDTTDRSIEELAATVMQKLKLQP